MNPFVQQMINHKINTLTPRQLYQLANQYNVSVSMTQARQITAILHRQPVNIADEMQRKRILNQIAHEVDPGVARKIKTMLESFL